MDKKQYLLSICIPTYNRADVLVKCLESIIISRYFNECIEVIISDNSSTDNTKEVCDKFVKRYSNVYYYRNEVNIGAENNFIKVLSLASGAFLKLHNDYSIFTDNGLEFILSAVSENINEKPLLFFSNIEGIFSNTKVLKSLDEVVEDLGWNLAWIGSYGFWKDDFDNLENKAAKIDTLFLQVDWFLRMFSIKHKCIKYEFNFTKRFPFKASQGGYNFIQIHLCNFGSMFKEYLLNKQISPKSFALMRKKQLISMLNWYYKLSIKKDPSYNYDSTNSLKIIWSEYKSYIWFYTITSRWILKKILNK